MLLKEVQGATKYSFNDKDSGRLVEGVNVWFLQESNGSEQVGKIPTKVTLPIEAWEVVKALRFPVDCKAEIEQQFTSRGIRSKVVSISPVR